MSAAGALGAFFTTLGAGKNERRKEALAERLQKEAEDRLEQNIENREVRAEKRKAKEIVGGPKLIFRENGTAENVYYNSNHDEVRREEATPQDIESAKLSQEHDRLGNKSLESTIAYQGALASEANARAADAPLDRSIRRSEAESRIRENNAHTRAYDRSGADDAKEPSISDATNAIIKDMADLKDVDTRITPAKFRELAQASVQSAANNGQDAGVIFQQALQNYIDQLDGKKFDPKSKKYVLPQNKGQ